MIVWISSFAKPEKPYRLILRESLWLGKSFNPSPSPSLATFFDNIAFTNHLYIYILLAAFILLVLNLIYTWFNCKCTTNDECIRTFAYLNYLEPTLFRLWESATVQYPDFAHLNVESILNCYLYHPGVELDIICTNINSCSTATIKSELSTSWQFLLSAPPGSSRPSDWITDTDRWVP